MNNITVTAIDAAGNAATVTVTVTYIRSIIPPDPATIAPAIDKTVATTLAAASEFLYTGKNAIQYGVSPGTIEATRIAVLRGKVSDSNGTPLSAVKITILNHPEFGATFTRLDGQFDMAVNGGGWLTVNYEKTGFLPSQRQVNAPWQDYAWLPEVVLIPFDTKSIVVNLNSNTIQVAQGSTIIDADGTRKSTLIFTPGTGATMKLPDNTWLSISNFTVRATEYTVGENGPKAMPGPLPPTSGYTYAAEYSIDEAVNMGATYVTFNKPVISYVENFLNFPVGGIVPVGWYDREKGVWIPSDNGKIIKILSISNGIAEMDIDGSNAPASSSALASLGITNEERQTLATLYQPDQSLWRVPISHFTPWDFNWPVGLTIDAITPNLPAPEMESVIDKPCTVPGSIIECQSQTLGEDIPIVGTGLSMNYRSNRVPGFKTAYTVKIPLTGNTVSKVKEIVLEINIAGRQLTQKFSSTANQTYTYTWDGKDAYGRTLQGGQQISIRVGYVYGALYYSPTTVRLLTE